MNNKIRVIAVLATLLFAGSCGGGNQESTADETAAPQSMVADEPVDDGQGIGKFKNVTVGEIDKTIAEKGKVTFEAKCSACHKTTDQKVVGPGLLGVTEKRQAAWILNMITNPVEMTKNDPTAKDLLAEHLTQMTFQDVTDEQAREILEYLRHNDHEAKEGEQDSKEKEKK